jgi:hypothetical protein
MSQSSRDNLRIIILREMNRIIITSVVSSRSVIVTVNTSDPRLLLLIVLCTHRSMKGYTSVLCMLKLDLGYSFQSFVSYEGQCRSSNIVRYGKGQ